MRKIWLIVQREYITRVRKKSFILLTLLAPIGMALIFTLPLLLTNLGQEKQRILVKDESGMFDALPDTNQIYFSFQHKAAPLDSLKSVYGDLGFGALLYIPQIDPTKAQTIEIFADKQISITTQLYIESILADRIEEINLKNFDLDKDLIRSMRPEITLVDNVTGTAGNKTKQGSAIIATAIGYLMGFSIYIVLLIYGTMVMRGVMEEKTNRIIEVIVSSVKPIQLMIGKIVGIGAVGLTQFVVWVIMILLIQMSVGLVFGEELQQLNEISTSGGAQGSADMVKLAHAYRGLENLPYLKLFGVFIFYFLGGYLLYSALFAAIGSLANDDGGDIQLYTFPVTMPIVISIIIMFTVVQQPETDLAFWASIIPLSSPIVMPARIPFGVDNWEIILSMVSLVAGFIFTSWLAAKIYRTGILMYGKKIRIREIFRWLRY